LLWGKGTGVNGFTECVCFEYCYGERELGLAVVMNVCFECCFGERELGLTNVLNVCVLNIVMGKENWG
jgi:hypothetical protein